MRVLIMALPVLVWLRSRTTARALRDQIITDGRPKRHVEQIAGGRHAYSVRQGARWTAPTAVAPRRGDDGRAGDQSRPGIEPARSGSRNVGDTGRCQPLVVKRP